MKIKVSETSGKVLDWLVSQAHGDMGLAPVAYSTDWAYGGPIIEREKFCAPVWDRLWNQWTVPHPKNAALGLLGPTALVAAMRCYVVSKLGEEVEVPDELMELSR